MSLSSQHLDAFLATARASSFSLGAKQLHITQSALSQRIHLLEDSLGFTLFIRSRKGISLTDQGHTLLRFCRARESMEQELLGSFGNSKTSGFGGVLRIAGYSSVNRSLVLPALAPFLKKYPDVQFSLFGGQLRMLPELLLMGEIDFLLMDHAISRVGIESVQIGVEEYVLAEAKHKTTIAEAYLDNDPDDKFTVEFFRIQKSPPKELKRVFLNDMYGLLDGAALGLGRVIAPRHLLEGDSRLSEVPGYKTLSVPIVLNYLSQPYYSKLHEEVLKILSTDIKRRLK